MILQIEAQHFCARIFLKICSHRIHLTRIYLILDLLQRPTYQFRRSGGGGHHLNNSTIFSPSLGSTVLVWMNLQFRMLAQVSYITYCIKFLERILNNFLKNAFCALLKLAQMFSRKMIKSEKWTDRQKDTVRWMDGQTDRQISEKR